MGNGFDHHSLNHRKQHHFFHQKTIFLPMFCRLSIKDIKLNHRSKDPRRSDEPSSPKVSCMGQVKRNNRVIGFPAAAAATAAPVTTHHHKYSKLKKLFSSKSLLPPTTSSIPTVTPACTAAAGGRSGSKSCRSSRDMCARSLRRLKLKRDGDSDCGQEYAKVVDVGELDPPLPVVKKAAPPGVGRDEVNLWKRRFNGPALKDLQIEQIHLQNSSSQLPTV